MFSDHATNHNTPRLKVSLSRRHPSSPLQGQSNPMHSQNYKPTALRWWFHLVLIIIVAALIASTEYTYQPPGFYEKLNNSSQGSRDLATGNNRLSASQTLLERHHFHQRFETLQLATTTSTEYSTITCKTPGVSSNPQITGLISVAIATVTTTSGLITITLTISGWDELATTLAPSTSPIAEISTVATTPTPTDAFTTASGYDQIQTTSTSLLEPEDTHSQLTNPDIATSTSSGDDETVTMTTSGYDQIQRTSTPLPGPGYITTQVTAPIFLTCTSSDGHGMVIVTSTIFPSQKSNSLEPVLTLISKPAISSEDVLASLSVDSARHLEIASDRSTHNQPQLFTISSLPSNDSPQSTNAVTGIPEAEAKQVVGTLSEEIVYVATISNSVVTLSIQVVMTTITTTAQRPSTPNEVQAIPSQTASQIDPNQSAIPTSKPGAGITVLTLGLQDYMAVTFLPTILATLLAFPLKLISTNARLMQPFHMLATTTRAHGASAKSSIFLRFDIWFGAASLLRSIKLQQPVIAITNLMNFAAVLLPSIAANVLSLQDSNGCKSNCFGTPVVSTTSGRAFEALLGFIALLLVLLIAILEIRKWKTGVSHNPWSITGMASLCLDPEFRHTLQEIPCGFETKVSPPASSAPEQLPKYYGVLVAGSEEVARRKLLDAPRIDQQQDRTSMQGVKTTQCFVLLTWWARCLVLLLFSSVLVIVAHYERTSANTGFERFMDSQGYGTKFLFTVLGSVLGECMQMMFDSKSDMHTPISPSLSFTGTFF